MVFITDVHMTGGSGHEHIAEVKWYNESQNGASSRAQMVEWIRNNGDARVRDGAGNVQVHVVEAKPPYIQTKADGKWRDNLLALPRY